jgi:hypothetical protein
MQLNGSFHPQQLAISAHHFLLAQVISYAISSKDLLSGNVSQWHSCHCLLGCNALLTGDKDRKLIPLSCTLILLANIPSFIVVLIFFFIFSLINIKKIITRENIIFLAKSALVSLLISSFYWLPLIYHMHYSDIFAFTKMQKSYEFINQTRVKIAHVLFATKNTSGTIGYSLFLSPGILIIVLSFIALFTDKERTSRSMLLVAVILTLMLCPVFMELDT